MKLVIIVLCLTLNCCFAQPGQQRQTTQAQKPPVEKRVFVDSMKSLRNALTKIQSKMDSIARQHQSLKNTYDTLTKYVNDGRLRESLRSAELTINTQNSWMTGFGTIYAVITIIFGFLSIVLSFQTREAIKKADDATDRLIERTDYFNKTISNEISRNINIYKQEFEKSYMDNLFRNLLSNLPQTRTLAYEELSALERSRLTDVYIIKLFDLLNGFLDKKEKAIVIEKLIEMHDEQNITQ
jgi:hypothetical protein